MELLEVRMQQRLIQALVDPATRLLQRLALPRQRLLLRAQPFPALQHTNTILSTQNPRQLQPLPRKALYVRERNMDAMYANPRQRQPLPLKALYAKEREMDTMYAREKSLLQTLLAPLPP